MTLLEKYAPVKSAWHEEFAGKVPYIVLANYCGISRSRISQILNGYTPCPMHISNKFTQFLTEWQAEQLDQSSEKEAMQ